VKFKLIVLQWNPFWFWFPTEDGIGGYVTGAEFDYMRDGLGVCA